jgi:uncharacterized protein
MPEDSLLNKTMFTVVRIITVFISVFLLLNFNLFPPGTIFHEYPYGEFTGTFSSIAVSLLITYLLFRKIEKLPYTLTDRRGWLGKTVRLLGGGCALGTGLYGLVALLQYVSGAVIFKGFIWRFNPSLAYAPWVGLVAMFKVGFVEEIWLRGYMLFSLNRKISLVAAVLLTSTLFSIMHFVFNPFNLLAFANLFLLGVFCALLTLHYRSLWPAIGFHTSWNWMQYNVLSAFYPQESFMVFEANPQSPWILTGTTGFSGEATIIAFLLLGLVTLVFYKCYFSDRFNESLEMRDGL